MTKAKLIEHLAQETQWSPKIVEEAVNVVFDTMVDALLENNRIEIRGFGSFVNRDYEGYQGRNPKTGKTVKVGSKRVPFFKVGKELKELVDQAKSK